jgi:hypothetical protein
MRRGVLVGLLALLAVPLFAGIRTVIERNRLEIAGFDYGSGWEVSSPTLRSDAGYLSYDVSGKTPKVTFEAKAGPHATWEFVDVKKFRIELAGKGSRRDTDREETGFKMQLRATEGPFRGWYLLRRVDGSLVLIKDPKLASTLRLVSVADVRH